MRILLIGRGHLGTYLKERLRIPKELHYIDELGDIEKFIEENSLDAVINTAGKTSLEWCEANPLEAFRCNVIAPLYAWRAIKEYQSRYSIFIHISSGCVWNGPFPPLGLGFLPDEPPTPQCFYSWTKAACDTMLLKEADNRNLCILRPRQVYSPIHSPRNTLTKLLTYKKLIDTTNSMTSAETIAKTIERMIKFKGHCKNGRIINVYDRETITPFKVGELLAEAGLRKPPKAMTKNDLDKVLIPKRVDTVLEDPFFEDLVDPPFIIDEMKRVIEEFKINIK